MSTKTETEVTPEAPWGAHVFYWYCDAMRGEGYWHGEENDQPADHGVYANWYAGYVKERPLHPSVIKMVESYRPKDFKQLALEWPHISKTDELRIAYCRNVADGQADRQLVTSIGKFLARHWPHVPDHLRRDAQAYYTVDERLIVHDVRDFIFTVNTGPRSCMATVYGTVAFKDCDHNEMMAWRDDPDCCEPDWSLHPYHCYQPEHGWSMAQRWSTSGGQGRRLDGRALIYSGPATDKPMFVRTYARNKSEPVTGWSETDFALHTWLEAQGYVKRNNWPSGAVLKTPTLETNSAGVIIRLRAPYIDGNYRDVEPLTDKPGYSQITHEDKRDSTFWCEDTDADIRRNSESGSDNENEDEDEDEDDETVDCEDCGRTVHQDDAYNVGRNDDRQVCSRCHDNDYTYVRGRTRYNSRGYDEYSLHNDSCGEMHDNNYWIDEHYPPDGVVRLESGDWAETDDCCCIDGDYYLTDDDEVICLENDEYALLDDACEIDGKWYLEDDCYESNWDTGVWFITEDERDAHDIQKRAEEAALAEEETEVT